MKKIERVVKGTCEAVGANYEYEYNHGYPAVVNHENETELLVDVAKEVVGEKNVIEDQPAMGGEDFAYYLKHKPGTFFFTGARNEELNADYPHHHPKFNIDERSMLTAAKTFTKLIFEYQKRSKANPTESYVES